MTRTGVPVGSAVDDPVWTALTGPQVVQEIPGVQLVDQHVATALVRALVAGIRARGERAFMHAAASNTGAIRRYESEVRVPS